MRARCRRYAGSRGRRGGHIDVSALPQLEHHERPEPMTVVRPRCRVVVEQSFEGRSAEPPTRACGVTEEHLTGERSQFAAKPGGERNAEAALAAVRDERR